jgi:integrase
MGDDVPEAFDRAPVRRILSERNMRTPPIIIGGEFRKDPLQVLFVEHNQMIGALASDRSDQTLNMAILPGRSSDYTKNLADSTRKNWSPWLDRIADYFGELRIAQFDRPERIRPLIRRWRNKWADKPRTADYGMQVLSRVLSYAVDPLGRIAGNPCEGIKQLYSATRSEIIWTDADIKQLKTGSAKRPCPDEIGHAVDLASHTGLRLGDLLRLSWSHVGEDAIALATGKSRGRREAVIPLYDDLRTVLARIPKHSTTILTNSRRRPWTPDGFGSSFNTAKREANINDRDLHFHDLRGTAATRFYVAGLSIRVIAEILAWNEDQVERIIRRYVGRAAATKEIIRQLNEAKERTKLGKPTGKR